jgi:hypothetical protein
MRYPRVLIFKAKTEYDDTYDNYTIIFCDSGYVYGMSEDLKVCSMVCDIYELDWERLRRENDEIRWKDTPENIQKQIRWLARGAQ